MITTRRSLSFTIVLIISHTITTYSMAPRLSYKSSVAPTALHNISRRNLSLSPFYIVPHQKRLILERFGKYKGTLGPGLHFKWPIIEEARKMETSYSSEDGKRTSYFTRYIDLREEVHHIPPQKVITQDNVAMKIDAILYASIDDPQKAIYSVQDLNCAVESLARTTLRNLIGSMNLDATLVSRDIINKKLQKELAASAGRWGVNIEHVELQQILPPEDIQHAMESQMKADRDQRAAILTAEGQKKAAILLSEGKMQASINDAEGVSQSTILKAKADAAARFALAEAEARSVIALADAEARRIGLLAEAEGYTIKKIKEAAPDEDALAYLVATKYISELPKVTEGKAGKTVVIPYDTASLAGITTLIKKFLGDSSR